MTTQIERANDLNEGVKRKSKRSCVMAKTATAASNSSKLDLKAIGSWADECDDQSFMEVHRDVNMTDDNNFEEKNGAHKNRQE